MSSDETETSLLRRSARRGATCHHPLNIRLCSQGYENFPPDNPALCIRCSLSGNLAFFASFLGQIHVQTLGNRASDSDCFSRKLNSVCEVRFRKGDRHIFAPKTAKKKPVPDGAIPIGRVQFPKTHQRRPGSPVEEPTGRQCHGDKSLSCWWAVRPARQQLAIHADNREQTFRGLQKYTRGESALWFHKRLGFPLPS
jgi:hypothetical protein